MTDAATRNYRWAMLRGGVLVAALIALLYACGGPSTGPEAELRDWVGRGVVAAEAKERRTLTNMISPDYADARGYERDQIDRIFMAYFMRMNTVELLTSIEEVNVIGDSAAELVITVGMAGTHDGVLGFSADAYQFALELQKNGSDWALISARWGELGKELR